MSSLLDLACEGLDWIRAQDPGLEAELYLSRGAERGVEARDGALEILQHSAAEGAGLRLFGGGRMAFSSAGRVDPEGLRGLYARVRAQLPYVEPDPLRGFAEPAPASPAPELEASLWEEGLFDRPLSAAAARLIAAAGAGESPSGKVLRAGYGEARGESAIVNTRGVRAWERGSSATVGFSVLAQAEGEVQIGSDFRSSRASADLDFSACAATAARRGAELLGARKLAGARRAVVFDPWAAGELFDMVGDLLCADSVQRGKSLLAGRLGQAVGSPLVTFRDDPRRSGGLASSLYDDEGRPTAPKTMIEGGVLKDFFYDTYTARRDGRASNASASRGSYRGLPGPSSSNFYLAPGGMTREALLAGTRDGILVLELMGMHMADPISGEFSVGVSGLAIRDGRLGRAVKGAMISGNVLDLLGRVDAVADDLAFYGGIGSPTFRIAHMTVA